MTTGTSLSRRAASRWARAGSAGGCAQASLQLEVSPRLAADVHTDSGSKSEPPAAASLRRPVRPLRLLTLPHWPGSGSGSGRLPVARRASLAACVSRPLAVGCGDGRRGLAPAPAGGPLQWHGCASVTALPGLPLAAASGLLGSPSGPGGGSRCSGYDLGCCTYSGWHLTSSDLRHDVPANTCARSGSGVERETRKVGTQTPAAPLGCQKRCALLRSVSGSYRPFPLSSPRRSRAA